MTGPSSEHLCCRRAETAPIGPLGSGLHCTRPGLRGTRLRLGSEWGFALSVKGLLAPLLRLGRWVGLGPGAAESAAVSRAAPARLSHAHTRCPDSNCPGQNLRRGRVGSRSESFLAKGHLPSPSPTQAGTGQWPGPE